MRAIQFTVSALMASIVAARINDSDYLDWSVSWEENYERLFNRCADGGDEVSMM